jgi:hypothetical protein
MPINTRFGQPLRNKFLAFFAPRTRTIVPIFLHKTGAGTQDPVPMRNRWEVKSLTRRRA